MITENQKEDVLRAIKKMQPCILGAASIARVLNWQDANECDWCKVLPPREGTLCAVVPERSRRKVERVLKSLVKDGKVVRIRFFRRFVSYALK